MNTLSRAVIAVVLAGLVGMAAWWWWRGAAPVPAPVVEAPPVPVAQVASAPPAPPAASAPGIQHPIELAAETEAPGQSADFPSALSQLFGRKSVLKLFQVDGFAGRVAATVDNLGRARAPARMWPLNPVDGRFTVGHQAGGDVVSADNGLRYTPYVLLLETVDLRQVVAFYTRFYPSFQQAYEELGYPGRYFNDRLVEVIDQLLATPNPTVPLEVRLPTINGPLQPPRPWVLYEFADPAYQRLSAGQKIMLRMGPVNERRVKVRLAELRGLVAAGGSGR